MAGLPPTDGAPTPSLALALVDQLGGIAHGQRSLREHLLGTRGCLVRWGMPANVCTAGLLHSVYGTETFGSGPLPIELRAQLRIIIGERAERLVWTFGITEVGDFFAQLSQGPVGSILCRLSGERHMLDHYDSDALHHLFAANAVDQLSELGPSAVWRCASELRSLARVVRRQAALELNELLAASQ